MAPYDDDDEEDCDDQVPPISWSHRYLAELTPEAENDYLVMPPSQTKRALYDIFNGADPADVIAEFPDVDVEDLADPLGGWSFLRVGGYLAPYLRLTGAQRRQLGRDADILVSRIRPVR